MNHALTASLALLLLGGVTGVRAVAATDRYRFEPLVAAGDEYETSDRTVLTVRDSSAPKSKRPPSIVTVDGTTRIRREVLSVQDGQPTAVRFTYLVASFEMTVQGRKMGMAFDHAGHTYLIHKVGETVEVTGEDGKPAPTMKSLARELDFSGPIRFPKVDFAPGDEWDAPKEDVAIAGQPNLGRTRAKFLGIKDQRGEAFATVQIEKTHPLSIDFSKYFSGGPNSQSTTTMKGDLLYSTVRQRPIEMDLTGPVHITGTVLKDGVETSYAQSGEARETYREKWIKVAGKPVSESEANFIR